MSAGVSEQRMKGQGNQVTNGPKEQIGEGGVSTAGGASEDFESWRPQQQAQGSTAHTQYATSVPISSATDPYSMSTAAGYYGSGGTFPYQSFGMGDGTWSNGTDAIPFLGGYTHDSYSMDGMFGPSTTFSTAFGQPSAFNYFPGNGDYSTWGTQLGQRKHYDDYYRQDAGSVYAAAQPQHDSLKAVEQGVQSLSIDMALGHGKDSKSTVKLTSEVKEPKKLTWASIASQPAKPQVSVQTSGLKKKGPGMPPGPIIPGKHNIDIGTWDTAKPAPPPPQPPQPPAQLPATSPIAGQQQVQTNVQTQGPNQVQVQQHQAQIQSQVQVQSHQVHQQQQQQQNQQGYQPHQNTQSQVQMQNQVSKNASGPGSSSVSMRPPWSGSSRGQAQLQQRGVPPTGPAMPAPPPQSQQAYMQPPTHVPPHLTQPPPQMMVQPPTAQQNHPVLEELRVKNNYNPGEFDLSASGARFFVIKSYSEDDIHRSIKYEIWCSTEHGNKRLDQAFRERESAPGGRVYLFFSVNGSGHFCGMAQMVSPVDYHSTSSVWSQDKWKGQFRVRWIYVKDVPNVQLRHIRLENNENKPVTNSRDTQEVPHAKGQQVLRIMHAYRHSTSIFDDFIHYEKRQEEEDNRKIPEKPVHHQQHHHHHHKEQRGGENNSRRGGGGRGGRNMN